MTRAAIYARVSTDRQEKEGTSLESQVAACVAYVQEQGWSIERVAQEQGSGSDIDGRPKFQSLMALAHGGLIDVLVCYHIDRLSRDVDDQGWIKRELRKAGVELAFVTGHQDPVFQAVEGAMGMQEKRQISERTKRGKEQTARNGKYLPGHAPYGYRHRREKVVGLDPDPVTAPLLHEMFETLARGGSATGIATAFNRRGVKAPRGQRWRCNTIRPIISNPIYKGQAIALRYESTRDKRDRSRRSMRGRPVDQWVALPAEIAPALVTPELWQQANDQLNVASQWSVRRSSEPELYLLRAGFVRCGYCGQVMVAQRSGGEPSYRCKAQLQAGCTASGSMRTQELDVVVWDLVTRVLKDPAWIRQQLEEQAHDESLAERITEIQAGLRRTRQEEARLAAWLGELDDPTTVIARMNEIAAARQLAEAELDGLVFQQHHAEQIARRLNGFDERFLEAYARVDAMGYEERRAVLRQFSVQVTLWKRDHEPRFAIDWAFDLGDDWDVESEDRPWVIFTKESAWPSPADLGFSSSA